MIPQPEKRYLALDLHRHYVMVGGVDAQQQIILAPRKVALKNLLAWGQSHLRPTDELIMESTTNVWHMYDHLLSLVARITVVHHAHVKQIAAAFVKMTAVIRWC